MAEMFFMLAFPFALIFLVCDAIVQERRFQRWLSSIPTTAQLDKFSDEVWSIFLDG